MFRGFPDGGGGGGTGGGGGGAPGGGGGTPGCGGDGGGVMGGALVGGINTWLYGPQGVFSLPGYGTPGWILPRLLS